MKTYFHFILTVFAVITFTFFACSSEDSDGNEPGGTVFCKQNSGTCSQLSLSTCMELVNAGAAQIVSSCDEPPPPPLSSSEEPPPPPSSSSSLPPPPSSSSQSPSSNSSGPWYCDYGPRHTCFESGCENFIGGGCFEISSSNPSASECDREYATIAQSCKTSGDFCDYGPLTVDSDGDCGGTGYCGGCYKYASNCVSDGGSRVTTCPASSLTVSGGGTQTSFTDTRDSKVYKTVVIGTQTWMAENLNYNPLYSKCYDDLESNCNLYGRLYHWSTAMDLPSSCNSNSCSSQIQTKHKGVCPSGWHIPSNAEWNVLVTFAGGSSVAGKKLKANSRWNGSGGTDQYGFSALPGGTGANDYYYDVGDRGYWWSASEYENSSLYNDTHAYFWAMGYDDDNVDWTNNSKSFLRSVRCLKD